MNIIIATGIYPPDIGGPATYTKILAEQFSRMGHAVTVITYSDLKKIDDNLKPKNYNLKTIPRSLPAGIRHLAYFLKIVWFGKGVDIIYAQDPVSAGLPASLAAILLRKRFFVRIAGDYAWEQGTQRFGVHELLDDFLHKTYSFPVMALRIIQKFCVRRAHRIIVPSRYLQSVVVAWGIDESRISVVYNAVSIPEVTLSRDEARLKFGLEGFILLSAGRLVPWKGFSMLIDVMPGVLRAIPNAYLVIAGSGPDEALLRAKAVDAGVIDKVRFTGGLSKLDLALYFKAADAFLLNTGYEGFSHQILEAMACQIPVVTTVAGGNREIIIDKENALVAAYNDKAAWEQCIIELYSDKTLYQKLAEPKINALSQYSKENMINDTINVLNGA